MNKNEIVIKEEKEIENIKSKICEDCRKCIQKNYLDCPFQNFDNEYCGDLEEIITSSIRVHKKEFAIAELENLKSILKTRIKRMIGSEYSFFKNSVYWEDIVNTIHIQIEKIKAGEI